jgi:hypothetical protein
MMTPRERAEATAAQIIEMLKDAWGAHNGRESDGPNVADILDAFAAEHVRALLADEGAMIEAMAKAIHADIMENATRDHPAMRSLLWDEMGLKNRDDYRKTARAALAALRKKAGV